MLDVLEHEFGSDWPERAAARQMAGHLFASVANTLDHARLLEFALRLEMLSSAPGKARALKELRSGDITPQRMDHTLLQLEVASLGKPLGWQPAFERTLEGRTAPVDVVLTGLDGRTLEVEVCVIPVGDRTAEALGRNRELVSAQVQISAMGNDVRLSGILSREPTAEEVNRIPGELLAAIDLVAVDHVQRRVAVGDAVFLTIHPGPDGPAEIRWQFDPQLDPRRLASTIEDKVAQARKSGLRWLRVDWRDFHWQLAEWWNQPLAVKALKVKQSVRHGLGVDHPLHGIVVTCGNSMAGGEFEDDRVVLVDGTVGLRRRIDPLRVRESVFIPLSERGRAELPLVAELYDAERAWLPWALEQAGLATLDAIVRLEDREGRPDRHDHDDANVTS